VKQAVTLVTGSARGIGLGVARHLLERGDRVHVVWRSAGPAASALCEEFGERAHRADVTSAQDIEALVAAVLAAEGRLDHVVHAVGEYVSGPLSETSSADFERMLSSNAGSAYLLFEASRAALRASSGDAVFFGCSGLSGFRARKITAAYAAAKSALLVLVKSWALEEASHGVRVNMVSPGHVPHGDAHADTHDLARLQGIPLGRPGTVLDLGKAIAFLSSSEAEYMTGNELLVSGGWML
jgi:3-oxoacyl-[acyl-carrier protein] reductase